MAAQRSSETQYGLIIRQATGSVFQRLLLEGFPCFLSTTHYRKLCVWQ